MPRRESCQVSLDTSGFTLIEMMVAVAIAGVIAAIAIPNFSKMAAVAREAEAKTTLGMIVTQEKAFYVQWNYYTTCLAEIGAKAASGTLYYSAGFRAADAASNTCGSDGATQCNEIGGNYPQCTSSSDWWLPANAGVNGNTSQISPTVATISQLPSSNTPGLGTGIGKANFSAGAAGNISSSATVFDQWTIKADKTLSHVQTGL